LRPAIVSPCAFTNAAIAASSCKPAVDCDPAVVKAESTPILSGG
jgi:hypothetical protein